MDIPDGRTSLSRSSPERAPTNNPPGASPAEVRGEDDPRTFQAIVEGRRLYVGNLPYMAKAQDVRTFFESSGYQM